CRLVDTAGDTEVELARFTLTLGVPQTGLAMAKIQRDGDSWTLTAIGEGIAVTQPARSIEALKRFL
ncbi:MAG: stress protein, partial [Nocardioides sp.]|nr:stress protein [Nocardioides sp.]